MIREAIAQVVAGATLSEEEAAAVMEEIMSGVATPSQMGAFLTALRMRPGGEAPQEIAGLARVMREKALHVHLREEVAIRALDTCGTGGDGAGTFNFSTAAGILAAAAGPTWQSTATARRRAAAAAPMCWRPWVCASIWDQRQWRAAFRKRALALCLPRPTTRP